MDDNFIEKHFTARGSEG